MRVLIVDDHPAVRSALRRVLAVDLEADVVGEASTGEEAVGLMEATDPDLVLLDVQLPGMSGPATAEAIRAARPDVRIVALTVAADPRSVAAMIAAGADSYLVKTAPGAEIREGIGRILDGQAVLAAEVLPGVVADLAARLRTERTRADTLDALDRMKREFISLVSDRLTTPVTAISGYAKTLQHGWERLPEETRLEFLGRIDSQAENLSRRLAQILTVSHLQGGVDGARAPFALDAVVRECLDRLADVIGDRPMHTDLAPVHVSADRAAIATVVTALLDNAVVHTAGRILVRAERCDGHAVLEVADGGPGVDAQLLADRLAQPFAPGDPSDTRESEGLGLSLYIARRLADASGGRIELESARDAGTTARLILPLAAERS
jgi:signal transduction histidine kinase